MVGIMRAARDRRDVVDPEEDQSRNSGAAQDRRRRRRSKWCSGETGAEMGGDGHSRWCPPTSSRHHRPAPGSVPIAAAVPDAVDGVWTPQVGF